MTDEIDIHDGDGFDVYRWTEGRHSGDRLATFDTREAAFTFAHEYAVANGTDMVVRGPAPEVQYEF